MDPEVTQLISRVISSYEENQSSEAASSFDPNSLALELADGLRSSDSDAIAYRLYRLLTDDEAYIWKNNLSLSTQSTIKSILLTRLNFEETKDIMELLCYTVAVICNISNDWPELLHFLHQCVTSITNRLKERFLWIFTHLSQDICKTLFPDIMILHSLLLKMLNDDALDLELRIAALRAAINFIQCLSSLNEMKRGQSLLPAMMMALADILSKDAAVQLVLENFIKLAKNEPRFFRIYIVEVVNTMLEIAEAMSSEERTRHLALDFVVTLVEARGKAPGMMKKLPLFTNNYFALLLNLLVDIEDEPCWHSLEYYLDEAGLTDNYRYGVSRLKQVSNALGGKTVFPIAIWQLDAYLVSPEWAKRHAALIALVYIAEGCSKGMIRYLDQVVSMVLHSFQDPHPRVRWAAVASASEFSVVLSPYFQEQYHNQVVPALVAAMDDFQNPQVQALAAVAVYNFYKPENQETLIPYLDGILNKLLVLLQNDNQMVQVKAMNALFSVASASNEHFQNYYDLAMPYLRTILSKSNDKSNPMLHSIALECISRFGTTVSREKFRGDMEQVVEMLKSSQESVVKEFGTVSYILQAWTDICTCLEKDFFPYLSIVMPFLVKCSQLQLQLQPSITLYGLNSHLAVATVHIVKFGDEIIYIKESDFLEVKSIVCRVFGIYAYILEEDFYPWIPQATSILVPLLKFYIHDDVRKYASDAMFHLLNSAKLAVEKGTTQGGNESYFRQLYYDIMLAFRDALYSEPNTKICAAMLYEFNHCLQIRGLLSSENLLHDIIDVIKYVIIESSCRKGELAEREKGEDFDAEEAELMREEIEQEGQLFVNVGLILFTLIKSFKAAFLPSFDELSSFLVPTRSKDKTNAERSTCFWIFGHLVENCGEAAQKYYNIYLPFLVDSSNDESPAVRMNALYGLGLCAEYGGSILKPFVGEVLPRINEVIMHLHAREPENEEAHDNAVSTLGKICQFHQESVDLAQIIPSWLNCLPIKCDMFEAKVVHNQLCSIIERSERELLGPRYEHFPKIMSTFAEVLCAGKDLATEETVNCMINVLRNLQKTIPPAIWASAWSLLLPQQEMELESVLSLEEDA